MLHYKTKKIAIKFLNREYQNAERRFRSSLLVNRNEEQLFILSRKGGILLVCDDYIYRSNFKRFGKQCNKIYWECVHNRSTKCRSRLKTIGNELHITNEVHNHESDVARVDAAKRDGTLICKKFLDIIGISNIKQQYPKINK